MSSSLRPPRALAKRARDIRVFVRSAHQEYGMGIHHMQEYRDPEISRRIAERIRGLSRKKIRLMEVCGTHTVSIFRHGIRDLLPETITLLSGPGCPVCVTSQEEIDAFIATASRGGSWWPPSAISCGCPGADLPSRRKGERQGRAGGLLHLGCPGSGRKNPDRKVVFLGVGFETTAPTIAASLLMAKDQGIGNYFVLSAHKLVPPALEGPAGDRRPRHRRPDPARATSP